MLALSIHPIHKVLFICGLLILTCGLGFQSKALGKEEGGNGGERGGGLGFLCQAQPSSNSSINTDQQKLFLADTYFILSSMDFDPFQGMTVQEVYDAVITRLRLVAADETPLIDDIVESHPTLVWKSVPKLLLLDNSGFLYSRPKHCQDVQLAHQVFMPGGASTVEVVTALVDRLSNAEKALLHLHEEHSKALRVYKDMTLTRRFILRSFLGVLSDQLFAKINQGKKHVQHHFLNVNFIEGLFKVQFGPSRLAAIDGSLSLEQVPMGPFVFHDHHLASKLVAGVAELLKVQYSLTFDKNLALTLINSGKSIDQLARSLDLERTK